MDGLVKPNSSYSDNYIEICFQTWYSAGRPAMPALIDIVPKDENGRKPTPNTVGDWRKILMWDVRADDLDARALQLADDALVVQKAEMLKRHAENAKKIADKALNFLVNDDDGGFDSSSSAVNAYFRGVEEERTAKGISDLIVRMSRMNNEELKQEIIKRLKRGSENDQIIDTESIDIPEDSAKSSQ